MDYEKVYKEALERAKTLFENSHGMVLRKWLEGVFPELKENEDERIRKALIEGLESCQSAGNKTWSPRLVPISDCIAWLEKQGEQKPAEWSEEDEDFASSLIDILDEIDMNINTKGEHEDHGKTVDWLKSLKGRVRPQWRPSEEQTYVLSLVCDGNELSPEGRAVLRSLYNDFMALCDNKEKE